MTSGIEAGVLAFSIREVLEVPNNLGALPAGARQMRVDRLDPDYHRMSASGRGVRRTAFRNNDHAAFKLKLCAVGADSQSNLKAKGFLEPFHGGGNV